MKRFFASLIVLLLGFALAQEPIRIGVNLELSGRFAQIGNSALEGIRTAAQEQSEALGRPIELSVCDNATTVEGSVACANRFVDEGVVGVLGAIASSMSIPAAEVLQPAGITMISTSSTNPATTQIGDYIFRMAYTDDFQGRLAADYALTSSAHSAPPCSASKTTTTRSAWQAFLTRSSKTWAARRSCSTTSPTRWTFRRSSTTCAVSSPT